MRTVFHPLFEFDLEEAASYYEKREPGTDLAQRFLYEADCAVTVIEQMPLIGGFVNRARKIRHTILKDFPYAIHYRVISDDEIYILGICHGARDPGIWRQRW